MSFIPHFEKVTRNSTISHFLLMLGYKLFSLYLPLFLLAKGLSLQKIGFTYLLIYLPIAVFSPLGTAIGALLGGLLIGVIGYSGIFISGGVVIALLALLSKNFYPLTRKNKV